MAGRLRPQAGEATLELALVAPILLLLVVGLLQFGLWYHAKQVVLASAQEGARVAAAEGGTTEGGKERARQLLQVGLGRFARGLVVEAREEGRSVVVSIHGGLRLLFPWPGEGSVPLDAEARAHRERFEPAGGTP